MNLVAIVIVFVNYLLNFFRTRFRRVMLRAHEWFVTETNVQLLLVLILKRDRSTVAIEVRIRTLILLVLLHKISFLAGAVRF